MPKLRLCTALLLLMTLMISVTGCQILRPSQLWKLNRGPALDESDAYFSVSDPLPTPEQGDSMFQFGEER